ncbi:MAG: tRNA glutamyl-Q(34) synthetase GluQRS [Polaromonas sp.]|nr:tRNA glutamyl-Q(34) synthetase GluQRS [Polaromonas sp.]
MGRFAPSPTGPLHAGSLVAALASWLDAKTHGGQWLVRIEDVDTPRCVPGADQIILQQLAACGLHPDEPPVYQSQRGQLYQNALDQLIAQSQAYPCGCSRLDIEQAIAASGPSGHKRERHGELIYPGTCRNSLNGKKPRSWRFLSTFHLSNRHLDQQIRAQSAPDLIENSSCQWTDRSLSKQQQNVSKEVGDFVLKRADGLWAYQLAVVVDDAAQGITHIVRGQDLADNTARQILLQHALGVQLPQYLHTPLVLGANGEKLSKQNGAEALNLHDTLVALTQAGLHLGITCQAESQTKWLQQALPQWAARFKITS